MIYIAIGNHVFNVIIAEYMTEIDQKRIWKWLLATGMLLIIIMQYRTESSLDY
jgi:hypothetical protein